MKQFLALLSMIILFVFTGIAQEQPGTITLDQALNIAFERNVTVAQASNSIDNAKASELSAYGAYIPRFNASAGYNRIGFSSPPSVRTIGGLPFNIPRTDTYYNTYGASVGLSYVLFDGFNREANLSIARSNENAAEETYGRTRQSIANSVIGAYLTVLRNEQQVKVFQQTLDNEKNRLDRIMEQNRLGAVAIGDVYRQQSTVATAEYNLISGQNTYDKSKADLLNLLALDVNQNYSIADPTISGQIQQVQTDSGVQSLGTFDELYKRALGARPDYAVAQEDVSMADAGVTQAWSTYYPSLSVNGSYSTNAQTWALASNWDNHATNVGLSLSWQLPEIFGAIRQIQSANIQKKNAVLQLQQKERDISVELKKALLDLEASRKQYVASQKSQVAAEQDRKTAEAKYNLGSGTLLDLQVANTTYLNAQLTTLFNAYNYYTLKKNLDLVLGEKKY
ncbi:MAG TPA: TolC family protein [Bacteroidota bacterium]|nr:TolC family protein [Bacteroidota bacterium]